MDPVERVVLAFPGERPKVAAVTAVARRDPSAPPPPAVTPAAGAPSITDQPARLGELGQQGLPTPEEFAAAKAKAKAKLLGV
ncbi:hypothetical protein STANM337S_06997 [Streptomyces tanashiensis]